MSIQGQIDLSKLSKPDIIKLPTSEEIYQRLLNQLQTTLPEFDATVESDPAVKILQAAAFCCERMLHDVNSAGHQVMLAFAEKENLDHLGALLGVKRFLVSKGDGTEIPPTPDVYESDETFRARIQKAPESFTNAGSHGSYVFHALSSHHDVDDVAVYSESPGVVNVVVLSKQDKGQASQDLLNTVNSRLSADEVRPLTDFVKVSGAEILEFDVSIKAYVKQGPDALVVVNEAKQKLQEYLNSHFKLGETIALSRIYGAFASDNIERVEVTPNPVFDTKIKPNQAARCTSILVKTEVVG